MTEHQRFQSYNQITFLSEVRALLRERGLTPDLPEARYDQAIAGAQQPRRGAPTAPAAHIGGRATRLQMRQAAKAEPRPLGLNYIVAP